LFRIPGFEEFSGSLTCSALNLDFGF